MKKLHTFKLILALSIILLQVACKGEACESNLDCSSACCDKKKCVSNSSCKNDKLLVYWMIVLVGVVFTALSFVYLLYTIKQTKKNLEVLKQKRANTLASTNKKENTQNVVNTSSSNNNNNNPIQTNTSNDNTNTAFNSNIIGGNQNQFNPFGGGSNNNNNNNSNLIQQNNTNTNFNNQKNKNNFYD